MEFIEQYCKSEESHAYIALKNGQKLNIIDNKAYEADTKYPVLTYTALSRSWQPDNRGRLFRI